VSRCRFLIALAFSLFADLSLMPLDAAGESQNQDTVERESRALQAEWATVFYAAPREQRVPKYKALLDRVRALKAKHPHRAEPLIVEVIILCTYSGAALGLDTLDMLEQARVLLEKAIDLDPPALDAAAYVTLGNLYDRLPGWPILYGDKKQARQYLETAIKLYPDAIDTNYFMGQFLLDEGDLEAARVYLDQARRAPIRPSLKISDEKLREETLQALTDLRNGGSSRSDFYNLFTPSLDK